jgi:hypothetical protein
MDDNASKNVDLKIPLNILGITSSDSYYRMSMIDSENDKLKKKMKNKKNKKSKDKNKETVDDEDEEEERSKVAIIADEMPEGAHLSDDDGSKKFDANDPHRLLNINLDE